MMSPSSNRFRPFEARHKSPHKSSLCASRGPRAIGRDESPSIKGMQSELEAGARGRAGSEQGTVPECAGGNQQILTHRGGAGRLGGIPGRCLLRRAGRRGRSTALGSPSVARLVGGTLYCGQGEQESQGADGKRPPHAQARLHFRDRFPLASLLVPWACHPGPSWPPPPDPGLRLLSLPPLSVLNYWVATVTTSQKATRLSSEGLSG